MKLYRIEGPDGRGPFRPGLTNRWRSPRGRDFPPPWIEAGLSLTEFQSIFSPSEFQSGCACKSAAQLRKWFSFSERRRLAKLGFRTVQFEADRVLLETPTQVVFERKVEA